MFAGLVGQIDAVLADFESLASQQQAARRKVVSLLDGYRQIVSCSFSPKQSAGPKTQKRWTYKRGRVTAGRAPPEPHHTLAHTKKVD